MQSLIINNEHCLFCIAEGRKHDSVLLPDSGISPVLEQHAVFPAGHPMCLYGDPAYPLRVHLQAPFRNVNPTPQMIAFNKCMSEVRVSVEWLFGDIVNYFKFMDFGKIGLSSVGKQQKCTRLYGNQTSILFLIGSSTHSGLFSMINNQALSSAVVHTLDIIIVLV